MNWRQAYSPLSPVLLWESEVCGQGHVPVPRLVSSLHCQAQSAPSCLSSPLPAPPALCPALGGSPKPLSLSRYKLWSLIINILNVRTTVFLFKLVFYHSSLYTQQYWSTGQSLSHSFSAPAPPISMSCSSVFPSVSYSLLSKAFL